MNGSEKGAVLFLRIAQDLKVSEATIEAETVETLYSLIVRQQAEITKMSGAISYLESAYTSVADEVKVKTVQEFAEKLKEYCNEIANQEWNKRTLPVSWADAYKDFIDDIDRLLEEMGCNDG